MNSKRGDKLSKVVKVDSLLLDKVEKFIHKPENKFKFANKKHFVDLAINNYLEKLNSFKMENKN
jgi:hypothetical protein